IKTSSTTTVEVLARAETLTTTDISKIYNTGNGNKITVLVDNTTSPYTVLGVQSRAARSFAEGFRPLQRPSRVVPSSALHHCPPGGSISRGSSSRRHTHS